MRRTGVGDPRHPPGAGPVEPHLNPRRAQLFDPPPAAKTRLMVLRSQSRSVCGFSRAAALVSPCSRSSSRQIAAARRKSWLVDIRVPSKRSLLMVRCTWGRSWRVASHNPLSAPNRVTNFSTTAPFPVRQDAVAVGVGQRHPIHPPIPRIVLMCRHETSHPLRALLPVPPGHVAAHLAWVHVFVGAARAVVIGQRPHRAAPVGDLRDHDPSPFVIVGPLADHHGQAGIAGSSTARPRPSRSGRSGRRRGVAEWRERWWFGRAIRAPARPPRGPRSSPPPASAAPPIRASRRGRRGPSLPGPEPRRRRRQCPGRRGVGVGGHPHQPPPLPRRHVGRVTKPVSPVRTPVLRWRWGRSCSISRRSRRWCGPRADALVRWLVTEEHLPGDCGSTVDRGWPSPAMPDPWVV